MMCKSYRGQTSCSKRISREKHPSGNYIFNSGNANVIINTEATQTPKENFRFPKGNTASSDNTYDVISIGNGGSPSNAGGGNPVYINYL